MDDAPGSGGSPAMVASGGTGGGPATGGTGGAISSGTGGMPAPGGATGGAGGGQAAGTGGASTVTQDAGVDAGPTMTDACDRACLIEVMQSYLEALVAHDPTMANIAPTAKYTMNGVVAKLGDGFWKTATKLAIEERMDFADPQEGQVGSELVIEEGSVKMIYQVRLKVVAHEITEIEAMEVREADAANGFFDPANMKPQPVFKQAIDPAKRMTRDKLKAEVDLYLKYLDGDIDGSMVHFDTNCSRYENGRRTANGIDDFLSQGWNFDVIDRYLVFDEEAGLVWGMFPFYQDANTLVVGELFKVVDGKIMMIQAVMAYMQADAWD